MTTSPVAPVAFGDQVAWDKDKLVVLDPDLLAKIDRPYLSPSTAKSIKSCGARMVADKGIPRGLDLFSATEKGSAAHLVLEKLYALPPGRRDEIHSLEILTSLAREEPEAGEVDYAREIGSDPVKYARWITSVNRAYWGIFAIEDPTEVTPYALELRLDGVEVDGVPFKGFVDRVDTVGGNKPGLKIIDYKTGRDRSKPDKRFGDDHGDQIRLYTAAVEAKLGEKAVAGALYYIEHGKNRRVAVAANEVRKTVREFTSGWDLLRSSVDNARFQASPSALCGWCPLVNSCPVAKPATSPKDPREGAASALDLGIPVIRAMPAPAPQPAFEPAYGSEPPFDPYGPEPVYEPAAERPETILARESGDPGAFAAHISGEAIGASTTTTSTAQEDDMTRLTEDKPWEETTGDGQLNLNSYTAVAATSMVTYAAELLSTNGQPLRPVVLQAMTDFLRDTVNIAQVEITGGSRSLSDGVHTRLRGALRTFVEMGIAPLPFGQDEAAWLAWRARATKFMVAVIRAAITTYETLGDAPDLSALYALTPAETKAA